MAEKKKNFRRKIKKQMKKYPVNRDRKKPESVICGGQEVDPEICRACMSIPLEALLKGVQENLCKQQQYCLGCDGMHCEEKSQFVGIDYTRD